MGSRAGVAGLADAGVDVSEEAAVGEVTVDEAGTEVVGLGPGLLGFLSSEGAFAPAPMPNLRFKRSMTSPGRSP